MSLMMINQFMSPYDELREVLIGESEFAALMETFIRMGLAAIEERMPNAAIDVALAAMPEKLSRVVDATYGLYGARQDIATIAAQERTTKETVRRREGNGILALRKVLPFRRGK